MRLLRLLLVWPFLAACNTPGPATPILYIIQTSPPALLTFSANLDALNEISLQLPPNCQVWSDHPALQGGWLALQLLCGEREIAWALNPSTSETRLLLPPQSTDSHILAWESAQSLLLRVDNLSNPHVVRADLAFGRFTPLDLPFTTYHADAKGGKTLYVLTRGIGFGSELWLSDSPQPVLHDRENILAFAVFSPDAQRIAVIKMPDTSGAFPPGELWLVNADGSEAQLVAAANAGHGFAPAWSPNGNMIAFIMRDGACALLEAGEAALQQPFGSHPALDSPAWSPDGRWLALATQQQGKTQAVAYNLGQKTLTHLKTSGEIGFIGWLGQP